MAEIDVKTETPVGHGEVTCISIYGGPDLDLGGGRTMLWADFDAPGVRKEFKLYLEDTSVQKARLSAPSLLC